MSEFTSRQKKEAPLPYSIEFDELSEYSSEKEVKFQIEKAKLYLEYLEDSLKSPDATRNPKLSNLANTSSPFEIDREMTPFEIDRE